MLRNKSVVVALCCALMLAAPAGATEFFWDDFNDNDMSDWTDLSLTVQPFRQTVHGVYAYGSRGEDPAETREARSSKPLSNTSLSDTVRISFEVLHAGGHLGYGGAGYNSSKVWMLNDSGAGYGIEIGLSKTGASGDVSLLYTSDWGQTAANRGSAPLDWDHGAQDSRAWWSEYLLEAVWDRNTRQIDLHFDGSYATSVSLPQAEHDTVKDFTTVLANPRDTCKGNWTLDSKYLSTDDIWIGDVPNPNAPDPILWEGDSDGNLKVDIVDLTAMAANWYPISTGPKGWEQGNYDFGQWDDPSTWIVDITDLTALAANWTFGLGSAPPVPEPATLALLAIGGVVLLRRRRA